MKHMFQCMISNVSLSLIFVSEHLMLVSNSMVLIGVYIFCHLDL